MNAKDLLIDFLNYAFLIALIIFFLVFFIVGDRFATFTAVIKSLLPLFIFSSLFLFSYKKKRQLKKKIKENGNLDEVITYLNKVDRIKDILVIVFVVMFNFVLSAIFSSIMLDDFIQMFVIFILMMAWNYILFEENGRGSATITFKKIVNDENVIYLLTMACYTLAFVSRKIPDIVDVFQSIAILVIMYFWHYILFDKSSLNR